MNVREMTIKLLLDSGDAKKKLADTQKSLDNVTQATGEVKKGANQAGDALKAAADEGKSSWEGLKGTIAGVFGAIGAAELTQGFLEDTKRIDQYSQALGISAEQWQSWEYACQSAGVEAEAFGDKMSDMGGWLKDFEDDSGPLKDFAEKYKVSLKDAEGATVGVEEAILRVADAAQKMGAEEAGSALNQLGFDPQTIPLLQKGRGELEALLKQGKEHLIYDKKAQLAAQKMREAWSGVTTTLKKLTAAIMGMLGPAFSWIAEKAQSIAEYVTANGEGVERVLTVIGVALGAMLVPKILAAAKALKVLAAASKPFLGLAAIVMAIALAFDDLMTYAEGGESALEDVWKVFGSPEEVKAAIESVKQFGRELIAAIEPLLPYIGMAFKAIGQAIIAVFVGIAKFIKDPLGTIQAAASACAEFLTSVFESATNAIGSVFSSVIDTAKAAWEGLKSVFQSVGEVINGVIEIYKGLFTGDFGGIISGLQSVQAGFSAIGEVIRAVLSWAQEKISSLLSMLSNGISSVLGAVGGAIDSVKGFFGGGGGNAREATAGGGSFGAGAAAKGNTTNTTTNNKNVNVSNHNNITVQTQATDGKGVARDLAPALNQNQTAQADVAFGA